MICRLSLLSSWDGRCVQPHLDVLRHLNSNITKEWRSHQPFVLFPVPQICFHQCCKEGQAEVQSCEGPIFWAGGSWRNRCSKYSLGFPPLSLARINLAIEVSIRALLAVDAFMIELEQKDAGALNEWVLRREECVASREDWEGGKTTYWFTLYLHSA